MDAFVFHLAEKLGKTVAELDAMSSAEYQAWQAFYEARGSFSSQSHPGGF